MIFIASCVLAVQAVAGFNCYSDVKFEGSTSLETKGLALDDTTLRYCSSRIPYLWPNSWKKVTSLRLFRAWGADWGNDASREQAWRRLQEFVEANDAKVLVGTQITCKEEDDHQDWEWAKQLLTRLTPSSVMGLAIGNELELLHTKTAADRSVTGGCITRLWKGGDFLSRFKSRVEELNSLPGFSDLPVTSVFTGAALYSGDSGHTFLESDNAQVDTFLKKVHEAYGDRFAYTFNFYPYFDGNMALDPGTDDSCSRALNQSACWGTSCNVPSSIATARRKVTELTNSDQSLLWIGETGWSHPKSDTLHTPLEHCPDWSSLETLRDFYEGFLQWDPSTVAGLRGPDHSFWFTIRDSIQFGIKEGFGLIEKCDSTLCKIKSSNFTAPEMVPQDTDATSSWWLWAFIGIGALVALTLLVGGVCIRIRGGGVQARMPRYRPDPPEVMRGSRQHP